MKNASIDTLKETVETLLKVYTSQLQVMELSKDKPQALDRSIMKASVNSFKQSRTLLQGLVSSHAFLMREPQSPQRARDLETLKHDLDQLLLMEKQVLFLMENLQDHTKELTFTRSDLQFMEIIFEKLNQERGLKEDPKEMIKNIMALKKMPHPQETPKDKETPSEQERHNQAANLKISQLIQDLILEKVHPQQIQGVLLTQYIHMMSLLVSSNPEAYFHHQVANAPELILSLIQQLNLIERSIKDDGPSDHMKAVAETVTFLKEIVKERIRRPLTPKDQKKHADRLTKVFMRLLEDIEDASVPFLASTFLYHWVRLSTLESNVSEEYFQKLERNWNIVFARIYKNEQEKAA